MSAPQTNIEKQERRHRGPLVGVVVAAVVALLGLVVWLVAFDTDQPGPAGQTGTEQAAPEVKNGSDDTVAPTD